MKKKNVAALLCASMVLTLCPGNVWTSEAANIAEQTDEQAAQTGGLQEQTVGQLDQTEGQSEQSEEQSGQIAETVTETGTQKNGQDNATEDNAGGSENADAETPEQQETMVVPTPVLSEEQESVENTEQQKTNETMQAGDEKQQNTGGENEEASADIQFVISAVSAAMEQSTPDMDSQVIIDFIQASNLFENDYEVFAEISSAYPQTASDIVTLRNRIAEVIAVDNKVKAQMLSSWFIRLHAENMKVEAVNEAVKLYEETYEGCYASDVKYAVDISYTDIRTGDPCDPTGEAELVFPVPEDYSKMQNPQIFTVKKPQDGSESTIELLSPEKNDDGTFFLEDAKDIQNILIADVKTELRGLSLAPEVSVNTGQKMKLSVTTIPEKVTESYKLQWKSSDESVAQVDKDGLVTGKKSGTAIITVCEKENDKIQASCKVTVVQGADALTKSVEQVLSETTSYVQRLDTNPTRGSEWFVLAMARNDVSLDSSYFSTYYNHFANYLQENKGILTITVKYTEYSKAILTLTSIGKDARNVAGYNLFEPLADFDRTVEQGPNGAIWALLALDSNPVYSFPAVKNGGNQNSREKLINHLLSVQVPGGGWAMSGTVADSDLTGMALQALAPYYHKAGYENVTAAIDQAVNVLANMQNSTGGFSTVGSETVESCAQVLTGLCALGIDPETDPRFIKGGKWMVKNLISYHIDNSGFMHVKEGASNNGGGEAGKVNGISTEQGFYALVAYQRMKKGQTSLYNMSDITLSAGGKGDGKGTGIVTPTPKPTVTPKPSSTKKKQKNKKADDSDSSAKSQDSEEKQTSVPGGQGKSLSGGSTGKSSSNEKSSSTDKNKKATKGWDFEAEPYVEDKSKITKKISANAKTKTADSEVEEILQEETTEAEKQSPDRKWDGLPSAMWGFIGVCAGVLITKGPEQINKRRKKKNHE